MARKKILWLCSWYPSRVQPFNGDFIQRHAQAASLFHDIHVLHVYGDPSGQSNTVSEEVNQTGALTEQVITFPRTNSITGKLLAHLKWMRISKQAIRGHILKNGKPDLVHVQVPMKMGIIANWVKRNYKIPFVVTEHWGIYNEVEKLNYQGRTATFKKYTRSVFDQCSAFISVSRYLGEGVNKLVTRKTFEVVPNVVNEQYFFYQPREIVKKFRFLHVSNMVGLKNVPGILRAFRTLVDSGSDFELVLVGDTDPSVRNYAMELGLNDSVQFRGEIPYPKVADEMRSADCLVLFSDIENSPCVIGEALSCGLPVIATQAGGIPELVSEKDGILVSPRNETTLVAAMKYMKEHYDQYDREQIAQMAREKFSYPVIGKRHAAIYESRLM